MKLNLGMANKVFISKDLPEEKITVLRYLYIVLDSELEVHYEFNNKGHIVLPIHFNEMNPFRIYKNLPQNLINKCVSPKKNIIGVLQIWVYSTKKENYARIRALGILNDFKGNRLKALLKLLKAMDDFCITQQIEYIETETSVIPEEIMLRIGFQREKSTSFLNSFAQTIFRQKAYVKYYNKKRVLTDEKSRLLKNKV